MPGDEGLLEANHAKAARQVVVQIGIANTPGTNANQYLIVPHFGDLDHLETQILRVVQHTSF